MKNPLHLSKKKRYADFVAPLTKMIDDLKGYITEQQQKIRENNKQIKELELSNDDSTSEINNSKHTVEKLTEVVKPILPKTNC